MTHVSVLSPTPATPAILATNGRDRRLIHHLIVTATATTLLTITLNGDTTFSLRLAAGSIVVPLADAPYRSLEFETDVACTVAAFTTLRA